MGAIRRRGPADECVEYLYQSHTVGRAAGCELVLDHPAISGHHATLRWADGAWTLRDLGSRNGSFVNGRRLGVGVEEGATKLIAGDHLTFADGDEVWELFDASEPKPMLIPLDRERAAIELDGRDVFALPSAEAPGLTIYQQQGRWQVELDGVCAELHDGQELRFGEDRYEVLITEVIEPTMEAQSSIIPRRLADLSLEIEVSCDEESAALVARVGVECHELDPRTAFYLLAFLARRRCAESVTRGRDGGWVGVESLCRELGLADASALGVLVYRCRKAIRICEIEDPAALIDRSRRGQLRIGVSAERLSVTRGG